MEEKIKNLLTRYFNIRFSLVGGSDPKTYLTRQELTAELANLFDEEVQRARIEEVQRIDRDRIMGVGDVMSYRSARLSQLRRKEVRNDRKAA